MRKQILMLTGLLLLPASALAATADSFLFNPYYQTTTAGTTISAWSLQAWDSTMTAMDTGFSGEVTLSSNLGPIQPTTVTLSAGHADVNLFLTTAGGVSITATSVSPAISSVAGYVTVNVGNLHHLIVLRHSAEIQEILTPGVYPGWNYSGVTLTAGYPVAVSIVAVDHYYNHISNGYSGTFVLADGYYKGVTPASRYTNNGLAGFTWTPDPPVEGQDFFNLTIYGDYSPLQASLTNLYNYIKIQDTFHLWIDGPTWDVIAGTPFLVTITASNSALDRSPTAGAKDYEFNLTPILPDSSAAHGTLSPSQARLGPNGATCNAYSYTKAEQFKINPVITSPPDHKAIALEYSQIINVKPSAPTHLSAYPSPAAIEARHSSVIQATVVDDWQNPVPNVPVTFEKIAGSDTAFVSPAQANTNASGVAESVFTGGIINETATVRVKANDLVQELNIDISVAPIAGDSMVNYPNPFNPAANETTSINYFLKGESDIEIRIYDAFGRTVFSRDLKAGEGTGDFSHATRAGGASFQWDGRNGENKVVANGIYLVKVTAHNTVEVQKFSRRVGVLK